MRLYASKIPTIVDGLVKALVHSGDIEVAHHNEFKADVDSILREYLRMSRELTERAKDQLESRGLDYSQLHRIRRQIAESMDFGTGEEGIKWIANQLIELFMQSQWVDEIYSEDALMRRKIQEVLHRNMQADEDLDREVRSHLKHLAEGTESFEIEYEKKLEAVRRKHGLA